MADPTAQCRVNVLMPQGLHLRPADMLVKTASSFQSRIELSRPNDHELFDARSILASMTIAAGRGHDLVVCAIGDDCEQAVAEIKKLFDDGFGELEGGSA